MRDIRVVLPNAPVEIICLQRVMLLLRKSSRRDEHNEKQQFFHGGRCRNYLLTGEPFNITSEVISAVFSSIFATEQYFSRERSTALMALFSGISPSIFILR